jgi:sec-independent protein translocase protein TatA
MFSHIGMPEILVILVVVLLLFGAKRLPEIGSSMGKGIREFKKSINDMNRSITEIDREERPDLPRERPAAAPTAQRDDDAHPEPKRLLS